MTRQVLPTNVKPTHYTVELTPNLETFKFTGKVQIKLIVQEESDFISLNVNDVTVSKATLQLTQVKTNSELSAGIEYLPNEVVQFKFDQKLTIGSTAVLTCEFEGVHNDQMAGFYRSSYEQEGVKKHLVVTQCEATDCRRIFPCYDEPNKKATFDVILNVEPQYTALANMNVIEEKTVSVNGKSLKQVKYATTPLMSPYLFALAVGEFDYLEAVAKPKLPGAQPVVCRTYTLKGQAELGRFGLGVCTRVLEFFTDFFGIPYPLPKMDMIAIPDFGAGAMENWGLVTYREVLLLFDEGKTSASTKKQIAYVIGHELAHQWFGNLVTMDWWNELWLNEGFATFVGWLATDHCFPDWKIWTFFVTDEFSQGLGLDALRSSHAIDIDVNSPSEINQIFDAISYSKGASVIRMLNAYLGPDKFAQGVSNYLKKHSFGNAKTTDLWAALSEASGKDAATMMHGWTKEMGYPIVTVSKEEYNPTTKKLTLHLQQQRFLSSGDVKPEDDKTVWHIPINVVTSAGVTGHLLSTKTGTIVFDYDPSGFYKLNYKTTGFYRVNYPASHLKKLGELIAQNPTLLTTEDRAGLVSDAFALARAGHVQTSAALDLVSGFTKEEDYVVLKEIDTRLGSVEDAWYLNKPVVAGIKKLKQKLFSPKISQVGYTFPQGEGYLDAQKRSLVIAAAASAGDQSVIQELQKIFANRSTVPIHPNLRLTVLRIVLQNSKQPKEDFDAVLDLIKNADSPDAKIAALSSIGAINDLELVKQVLVYAMDPETVKPQDITRPIGSIVSGSPLPETTYPLLWQWFVENWSKLHEKFAISLSILGNLFKLVAGRRIGKEFIATVHDWAQAKGLDAAAKEQRTKELEVVKRPMEQALETVASMTKWQEDASVATWVSKL
ncbi:peptidase family M1-domain-containing protein [Gorgonomyces haynaldii]|nr:peptidase family M1-domain-containing protein [Gorgonomyces haynaldii]